LLRKLALATLYSVVALLFLAMFGGLIIAILVQIGWLPGGI